ncbi:cyclic nucleotide-binding domain-containing protein [Pseudorhodoferax sp. Leaf265]|jgi:CRP-like cAMP-binding protein|uniref:cyclic nucleotide-binding domain-containing protein n=1 Tax=Pseudorhodoferax sp. Leaf265 TaxID=1736315 RepID=UPI0006F3E358|nr:cyclic nucleotide-binding domain-containing protein [Pseudorhodoferax sp. Leaf265]KQP15258.1 Crp/Fnr family transcriptional regulator [Pseudorhodoferax sp. Leaf265]PZQ01551.1 MAG: cyclic nucleotide-binding domain-containing protein [Variovorax paradoxus]PZQ14630.1 MAG: cyclic nucleotide-binding domain-containing protein [Variovorax paradoxus]
MRSWFGSLRGAWPARERTAEGAEPGLFAAAQPGPGHDEAVMVPWETRATEIGARSIPSGAAIANLQALWARDRNMSRLEAQDIVQMERFFRFVRVGSGRVVIHQHEFGNFMVVLLRGSIAVDRRQPWGELLRLAESRPGEILGEMSLLDSGQRFSACTTLTDCEIAVLPADGLDEMMGSDPRLAAALIALLARKLSLRLRAVNARLTDRPNQEAPYGTRSGQ